MAVFRVETVLDQETGLYRAEVYYPSDSATPLVVGHPIYTSHEHAVEDAVAIFKAALPGKQVSAD